MIKIALTEIVACISNALASGKKNILFISPTLEYDAVLEWSEKHPDYFLCREVPTALYEQKSGILVKNESCAVITTESLEQQIANKPFGSIIHSAKKCFEFRGFLGYCKTAVLHQPVPRRRQHQALVGEFSPVYRVCLAVQGNRSGRIAREILRSV